MKTALRASRRSTVSQRLKRTVPKTVTNLAFAETSGAQTQLVTPEIPALASGEFALVTVNVMPTSNAQSEFPSSITGPGTLTAIGNGGEWYTTGQSRAITYRMIGPTAAGVITINMATAREFGVIVDKLTGVSSTPFRTAGKAGYNSGSVDVNPQPALLGHAASGQKSIVYGVLTSRNINTWPTPTPLAEDEMTSLKKLAVGSGNQYSGSFETAWRYSNNDRSVQVRSSGTSDGNLALAFEFEGANTYDPLEFYIDVAWQGITIPNGTPIAMRALREGEIAILRTASDNSSAPAVPTVTGGGVTWTNRLTTAHWWSRAAYQYTLTADGPGDGTPITVTWGANTINMGGMLIIVNAVNHPPRQVAGNSGYSDNGTESFQTMLPGAALAGQAGVIIGVRNSTGGGGGLSGPMTTLGTFGVSYNNWMGWRFSNGDNTEQNTGGSRISVGMLELELVPGAVVT